MTHCATRPMWPTRARPCTWWSDSPRHGWMGRHTNVDALGEWQVELGTIHEAPGEGGEGARAQTTYLPQVVFGAATMRGGRVTVRNETSFLQ